MCGNYDTSGKHVPHVRTLIYLGKNLYKKRSHNEDEYIFLDEKISFIDDITFEDVKEQLLKDSEGSEQVIIPHDRLDAIKSFAEMLEWLESLRKTDSAD